MANLNKILIFKCIPRNDDLYAALKLISSCINNSKVSEKTCGQLIRWSYPYVFRFSRYECRIGNPTLATGQAYTKQADSCVPR